MNPLKRVRPDWATIGIQHSPEVALKKRPELAAIVAQCIGISSETEMWIGVTLAGFLKADYAAAVAMLNSVQSRSAQMAMFRAAAAHSISEQDDRDLLEAILTGAISPAFTERDRMAHWLWGVSDVLPDDLLLMEPIADQDHMVGMFKGEPFRLPRDHIFVFRKLDLEAARKRIEKAQGYLRRFNLVRWGPWRDQAEYAEVRLSLTSEPVIHAALARLSARRQNTSEEQQ